MRIAVNTRFLLPGKLEGLGWYTYEIARRLALGHPEDEFIFLFDRPYDPAFIFSDNVRAETLFPPARHPLLWYAWFEGAVPAALRRLRPDVFFSPDSYLSLRAPTPTVMTVHDVIPLQRPDQIPWQPRLYYRRFLPRYIRRADHIITVSDATKAAITAVCGTDPAKITTVYNGCRAVFQPLAAAERVAVKARYTEGRDYFFYVGAIHPRKNLPRLIRAFDRFKAATEAPHCLLLAGRFAWQTGEVRQTWEAARHKADIRFLDYVPETELTRLVAAAAALTYCSLDEGFGLPLVEAMYCDTPVITSDAGALREIAGDAALLADPEDETAITAAMQRLYTDKNLATDLTLRARGRRTAFDWNRAAEHVYDLLKNAIFATK